MQFHALIGIFLEGGTTLSAPTCMLMSFVRGGGGGDIISTSFDVARYSQESQTKMKCFNHNRNSTACCMNMCRFLYQSVLLKS